MYVELKRTTFIKYIYLGDQRCVPREVTLHILLFIRSLGSQNSRSAESTLAALLIAEKLVDNPVLDAIHIIQRVN